MDYQEDEKPESIESNGGIITSRINKVFDVGEGSIQPGYAIGNESIIVDRELLLSLMTFLKEDLELSFDCLIDVTAVDRLQLKDPIRFVVIYQLYSYKNNFRFSISAPVPENNPHIDSVVSIWPGANWLEREVYDMYGINFDGHPDLRRILMPDDFGAHPLRKDYPLHVKGERDNFVF